MKYKRIIRCLTVLVISVLSISIFGCSDIFYLSHAFTGNSQIMLTRVPIQSLLAANNLDDESRKKLKMVLEVRSYASEYLGLPKNKSYTMYSQLNRQHAGWDVFVAPQFSVEPVKSCFPIAGCVPYRGYFSQNEALDFARKMSRQKFDVYISPFDGYSTLGWYNDPVLSTQLRLNSIRLAGLIIHELAHQKFYVPDDSDFNEAFAVTVERAGTLRWLEYKNRTDLISEAQKMWSKEDHSIAMILEARTQLINLYHSGSNPKVMAEKKALIFADLESQLHGNRAESHKSNDTTCELNNAYMASIDTYYLLLPVFQRILTGVGGNFPQFYEKVRALGKLPPEKRRSEISVLQKNIGR